jgi:hypothetical protein
MRTRIVALAVVAAALAIGLFGVPLAFGLAPFAVAEERLALQRVADFTARSGGDGTGARRIGRSEPVATASRHGAHMLGGGQRPAFLGGRPPGPCPLSDPVAASVHYRN